ncbi:DNA ligase D [Legionella hackeliae]|uniref:DNA ligase (ATP) n=1 Tax=Legionella hackeliae TaxID=449 RepID=A0A0A8URC6_LEGHA|nr:DNA ligase D [Legionella hackeliae]KTD10553.1 putative ATP-dependent DNA ligase YkoU [Legionella hackeliae]CEK10056.1 ATP-dependent DNA ligase [Legionella hackeliae]STX46782.1 Putative DNA ligase-like protein Rv0938/MT0965 [Legionella hackeliae]
MGLDIYHRKRDFKKTPEPKGRIRQDKNKNYRFVIQKHAASRLHYDFRLELDGVLKSWAVPKGPCLDPNAKRLAVHVEDHPLEYGSFEGVIPKGEYGGGTVMLWDEGKWEPLDEDPRKAYEKGHLRFELHAKKLHGRWDLFRFKNEDNSWFLVKYEDEFARPLDDYDITLKKPNSVVTDKSLDEIAENYDNIWTKEGLESSEKKKIKEEIDGLIPAELKASPFPERISPQLTTLVDKPPQGSQWLHEIKFDGYRIIAFKDGKSIRLISRNNIDWTRKFKNVIKALQHLPATRVIVDGEVVLLNDKQKTDFQRLQNAMKGDKDYPFYYYIFDLLYYEKFNLKSLPLLQRKEILEKLLLNAPSALQYSDHIAGHGENVLNKSCELGLEGIISKDSQSTYQERRSKSWVKIKCIKRQEFVIGGYLKPQRSRQYFRSLLLGVFNDEGELIYTGNVGTGFTESSLKEVYTELQKNLKDENPFNSIFPDAKNAIWVNPVLIAEVEFSQWTSEGKLRHPSFKGLRKDKEAGAIKREEEVAIKTINKKTPQSRKITISSPEKILYNQDNITKQDLYDYYDKISEFILPFVRNRPLTLVRCPESYKECFYQKHYYKSTPKALCAIPIKNKSDDEVEQYIYLKDKEGLLSLVQIGALEIHPWGSRIDNVESPDMITIDLDPGTDVSWKEVVKAAFEIKKHLEAFKLTCFVKTTGGKGLHVVVPIFPEYNWEEVKNFTHVFVEFLERINPNAYVTNMAKAKRKGKIFVDYLRNQRGATAISAYSTRARLHAPVATPIHWDELTNDIKDTFYTIHTLPQRLKKLKDDPWKEFWNIKQSLRLDEL